MEYIDAPDRDVNDSGLAANAVQTLIGPKAEDGVPGPVGGGLIKHPFFPDWSANYAYDTVETLSKHINFVSQYRPLNIFIRLTDMVDVENYGE